MSKSLGTLIHKCLACHYGLGNWELGLEANAPDTGPSIYSAHKLMQFAFCPQAWAFRWKLGLELRSADSGDLQVEARQTMLDYLEAYRRIDTFLQPVAVEHEIIGQIGTAPVSVRIDLVASYHDRLVILDHKTAANVPSRLRGIQTESALAIQEIIFKQSLSDPLWQGMPYGGLYLNLIETSKKPNFNERFQRKEIVFDPGFISSLPTTLSYVKDLIDANADRNPWHYPRVGMFAANCMTKYGICPYRALCLYGRSESGKYSWNQLDQS